MGSIDRDNSELTLWEAAVRAALGPLSAYLTPENYGLSCVGLSAASDYELEFEGEIAARLDLARAIKAVELIREIGSDIPQVYRHAVHYCDDRIDGALLVPRLIAERAAGRLRRIPVLRASKFSDTPEALLVSESLRLSRLITSAWRRRGGAEGALAINLGENLATLATQQPWHSLALRPRPVLRTLASTVKGRTIAGWNSHGGPIDRLADLMLDGPEAVSEAAGPIAFLLSRDQRFEDRLFELICLGWLIAALRTWDPSGILRSQNLQKQGPIFTGSKNGTALRLYYQAGYFSSTARYVWQKTAKRLRAIPDFSIELETTKGRRSIILDAKNRSVNSTSEIIYKLLGYRENLGITPYISLGIAPASAGGAALDGVSFGDRHAGVIRVPLGTGGVVFKRAVPRWINRLIAEMHP